MKYLVSGFVKVSCWTEVEADSPERAIEIAKGRPVAEVLIDGSYPVDECFHLDSDGEPDSLYAEAA